MSHRAGGFLIIVAASLSVGWFALSKPWSGSAEPPSAPRTPREIFAADRDSGFDADRALDYLKEVCKIGPRISGTDGMKQQQELLKKHFEALGGKVELQRFTARQRSQRQPTEMANLIVSWFPERKRRVILCSHYDTRPIADRERDPRKWHQPFLSANDGGSGVALMMELANHMKELRPEVGVDFVIFDGEEYIFNPALDGDVYFFGSEHFADVYRQTRTKTGITYVGAVLLDMIAGENARFPIEQNSWFKASSLVKELWQIAADQKAPAFQYQWGPEVRDDHLALNGASIPTVDIIDFNYPHWHLLSDLPQNCSGDSLAQVARVVMTWLQRAR